MDFTTRHFTVSSQKENEEILFFFFFFFFFYRILTKSKKFSKNKPTGLKTIV